MAVVAPVVFLALLELALSLAGYGANREQPAAYDRFTVRKARGTVRVMVVGGSAAAGWPFHPRGGPVPFLRELLEDVAPGQPTEVLNCAVNGLTSEGVAMVVQRLARYEADVLIVACGHNEYYNEPEFNRLIAGWDPRPPGWLSRTRTRVLLEDMVLLLRGGPPMERDGAITRAERAQVGQIAGPEHFEPGSLAAPLGERLRGMVELARSRGIAVVLTTMPSNLGDAPPNRPEHRPGLADEELAAWRRSYAEGRSLAKQGQHDAALAAFALAAASDGQHAGLLYARARSLAALGRHAEAKPLFAAARDRDYLPMRATAPRNDAVRRVSAETGVVLCDAEQAFAESAPHGIPGDEVFCDHVHLTLSGAMMLARGWARTLEDKGLLGPNAGWDWPRARPQSACERALELTPAFQARAHCDVAFQCALAEGGGALVEAFRRPQCVEALRARARQHLVRALRLHRPAVEELLAGFQPYVHCYVAMGYEAAGEPERAAKICEEVLDVAPGFALAYKALAEARAASGDRVGAADARARLSRLREAGTGGDDGSFGQVGEEKIP